MTVQRSGAIGGRGGGPLQKRPSGPSAPTPSALAEPSGLWPRADDCRGQDRGGGEAWTGAGKYSSISRRGHQLARKTPVPWGGWTKLRAPARGGGGGGHATFSTAKHTDHWAPRTRKRHQRRSTGRSGRQKAATRRNMRREERGTIRGPVKEQQPDGMSHGGAGGRLCEQQKQSNGPRNNQHNPPYANHWAPLTRKWHTMPHPAHPRHTNRWARRTRKQHQQAHRPQRPTESRGPAQHAKGRTCDCPGPRKETTTRQNVTQGGGGGSFEPRGSPAPQKPVEEDFSEKKSLPRDTYLKMISVFVGIILGHMCWGLLQEPPPPPQPPVGGPHHNSLEGGGVGGGVWKRGSNSPPPPQHAKLFLFQTRGGVSYQVPAPSKNLLKQQQPTVLCPGHFLRRAQRWRGGRGGAPGPCAACSCDVPRCPTGGPVAFPSGRHSPSSTSWRESRVRPGPAGDGVPCHGAKGRGDQRLPSVLVRSRRASQGSLWPTPESIWASEASCASPPSTPLPLPSTFGGHGGQCFSVQPLLSARDGPAPALYPTLAPNRLQLPLGAGATTVVAPSTRAGCSTLQAHPAPPSSVLLLAVLETPNFFWLRTTLKDSPQGPPTANRQPPPTANRQNRRGLSSHPHALVRLRGPGPSGASVWKQMSHCGPSAPVRFCAAVTRTSSLGRGWQSGWGLLSVTNVGGRRPGSSDAAAVGDGAGAAVDSLAGGLRHLSDPPTGNRQPPRSSCLLPPACGSVIRGCDGNLGFGGGGGAG